MAVKSPPQVGDVNPATNPKAQGPVKPKANSDLNLGAPPPVPVKPTKGGSAWQQFVNYWTVHGYKNLKRNAQPIYLAAKAQHIDPVTFGALILNESGADFNVADSSKGAIGIGQLLPSSFLGQPEPWNPKHTITEADLRNRGINLRLSAWYFGTLQGSHPDAPYGAYNAGQNAPAAVQQQIQQAWFSKWITRWNPKYTPTGTTSPAGPAGTQVPGGTGAPTPDNTFHDPYVTGVMKGKAGKLATTADPNKALQYNGFPLTRSAFLSLRDSLTSHYVSYTGQRPTNAQIQQFLVKGWNPYTLDVLLSKSKNFTKSPIYKQYNNNFGAAVKDLIPNGGKIPHDILRQAVVNNWNADAVAQRLRKLPTYVKSNEFKGNLATLTNVYNTIMGNATQTDYKAISDAALAGWSSDQFAAYLRSHQNYSRSTEYQSKALGFLSSLGLITGAQPVLRQGATPGPGYVAPNTQGPIPTDPRIKGNPNNIPAPLPGLGATLG